MSCGLRIVSDNAADRATLTATDAAQDLGPEWLKTDRRGEVCRVLASACTITATWAQPEAVGLVAIPACNLSASSRIRVRTYEDGAGTVLLHDSDWQWAASGPLIENWDVYQPVNVNVFAYGATCVAVWLADSTAARHVVIDIEDEDAEFLDLSRLVIGPYIEPRYGAAYGAAVGVNDQTTTTRAASGDLIVNRGPSRRTVDFDLSVIDERDRPGLLRVLSAGIGKRHFISLVPEHPEPTIVQSHMLYGTLRTPAAMAWFAPGLHQTQYQLEEF